MKATGASALGQIDARSHDGNGALWVHLTLGGPGEVTVSYATANDTTPSAVAWSSGGPTNVTAGSANAYSQLMYFVRNVVEPSMGEAYATEAELAALQDTTAWSTTAPFSPYGRGNSYYKPELPLSNDDDGGDGGEGGEGAQKAFGLQAYLNPQVYYTSPTIHTVTLTGLAPGTAYTYSVADDDRQFTFTMPPDALAFPYTFGLTADVGQTLVSQATRDVLLGALAAVDDPARPPVVLLGGDLSYADGFLPRWDDYGRMFEGLAARFPVLTVGGNHEVGEGEAWVSYNARYPTPFRSSGSVSNLWCTHRSKWSRDVGPVHVIGLCSYAATANTSLQYRWLQRDFAKVDRAMTPWVLVMWHTPWYNSNSGHRAEGELMRRSMEPLMYANSVDVVLNGHVHAYERNHAVYNGCRDECGPVYLNLGNGGNYEGAYVPWLEPQPEFSAFRASGFGPATLTVPW